MLNTVTTLVVSLLGVHALAKLAFFFVLPYRMRRAALDRAYGDKPTATRVSDVVLLGIAIGVAILLLRRGIESVSFLGGLWIGATLIQLYFHRFHSPLRPEEAPPRVDSPIKMMSYAIQASPQKPWREMVFMAVLISWALAMIFSDGRLPSG